jgi:glycosyltransferase involved in cell wall biosynthesis
MVHILVEGLPGIAPDIEIHHVNLSLSHDTADIGRWRPAKLWSAWRVARQAIAVARQHNCDALYYVPAPGKRIALWRDIFILRQVRPLAPKLILHWHASGLGAWLEKSGTSLERHLAHAVLDHADLSIVLAPSLTNDAERFAPRRTAIIPNGIADSFADTVIDRPLPTDRLNVLFIGLGNEAKGLFTTLEAIAAGPASLHLTFAGAFETDADAARFHRLAAPLGDRVRHVGFVSGAAKAQLFRQSHVLAFPTQYAHEAFPLVLLEALAADLPIVTTRWRAIPDLLPDRYPHFVNPHNPSALASALEIAARDSTLSGHLRRHFLGRFTQARFLQRMAKALPPCPRSHRG